MELNDQINQDLFLAEMALKRARIDCLRMVALILRLSLVAGTIYGAISLYSHWTH